MKKMTTDSEVVEVLTERNFRIVSKRIGRPAKPIEVYRWWKLNQAKIISRLESTTADNINR